MSNGQLADEEFIEEAIEIADRAQRVNLPLRIMGACAIRLHCQTNVELHKVKMKRNITDLDFVTLRKHGSDAKEIFRELGYSAQIAMMGMDRDIYHNDRKGITADVFFDKLDMCHTLFLTARLQLDFPTISLADLLLEKLQVVKITEKDIKDIMVLVLEHELGETNRETIDSKYVAKLLAEDWGFYYTVTTNLNRIRDTSLNKYSNVLSKQDLEKIQSKIDQILSTVEKEPKSMKWKMRQKVGTKKIWYNEVEEKGRGTLADYLMNKNVMKTN